MDLSSARVVVTGGSGFLGRRVVAKLELRGCKSITVPRSREYDLRERSAVQRLYRDARLLRLFEGTSQMVLTPSAPSGREDQTLAVARDADVIQLFRAFRTTSPSRSEAVL